MIFKKSYHFSVLIILVGISGMTQGMLIPLLTVILEERNVSSLLNGFNATSLYIGTILISPFMAIVLKRYGYKTTIIIGLTLTVIPLLLFPFTISLIAWFGLRLVVGIGDVFLHYATQIWVTTISSSEHRGRNLTLYGFSYGVGFSLGPQGLYLLPLGLFVPFVSLTFIYLFAYFFIFKLPNTYPENTNYRKGENTYFQVFKLGWLALLPSFVFGFMEATLNNSLPIYLIRIGVGREWIPMILFSFIIGGLIFQIPLGFLSDRVGRKVVIIGCSGIGALMFSLIPLANQSQEIIIILLSISGAAVGSFYSLGLAFAVDILPKHLIPTTGIITGINYSVASIIAPILNGFLINYSVSYMIFFVISGMLLSFFFAGILLGNSKSYAKL